MELWTELRRPEIISGARWMLTVLFGAAVVARLRPGVLGRRTGDLRAIGWLVAAIVCHRAVVVGETGNDSAFWRSIEFEGLLDQRERSLYLLASGVLVPLLLLFRTFAEAREWRCRWPWSWAYTLLADWLQTERVVASRPAWLMDPEAWRAADRQP